MLGVENDTFVNVNDPAPPPPNTETPVEFTMSPPGGNSSLPSS